MKRPTKKATTVPTTGVVIKDTPDKSVSKIKAPTKIEVPDEHSDKTKDTSEGTRVKPRFLDVSKEDSSDSDDDSWGDSENESDDANDKDDDNDDNRDDDNSDENDKRGNNDGDEEYVHTQEKDKSDDEEKMFQEEDDDVTKELYGDLNITQGLRDTDMTNAEPRREDQQNASHESGFVQEKEDAHVTLTTVHDKTEGLLQSSSISSDFASKFLNLDDLSLDMNSLMNTSTVPPPPPLVYPYSHPTTIPHQQTPYSTKTTTNPTLTFPEIPNFTSLFQFDQRVSALETKVSDFNQTSQFVEAVSLILGIVDNYFACKLKEEVKAQVSKIMPQIKDYVTESLRAEVLTSYAVAALLLEYELKKILIDKMETNKLIKRSDIQKSLYNALIESYNTDKDILSTYGDIVTLKRRRNGQDKDEDPCTGSDRGINSKSIQIEEPEFKATDAKMYQDQGIKTGHIVDQPNNEAAPNHDWFQKPNKPLTPDCAWNKSKFVDFRPPQKWIRTIAKECFKERQPLCTFDELMVTPIDFSAFVMNHLKIDNLTQEILVGPAFNLLKGTCKSFVKEGDFPRLKLCDIEDMLLLLVQKKLSNLDVDNRDNPLDSVEVLRFEKRSKSKNKGKVPTKMELILEQTQQ
nr:hypothetical protein [Tanacetum cinerariifolium]